MAGADSRERAATEPTRDPAIDDAWLALQLFAIDPASIGGIVVRASAGPVRDRWLADLRALLPSAIPWRAVPVHVDVDRLIGGIDLAATLQRGRPVALRGLLAEADGGVVLLAMAERASGATAAQLAAVLDAGAVVCSRHGIDTRETARFGVVAFDEGEADDERSSASLGDRLAFHLDLRGVAPRELPTLPRTTTREAIAQAAMRAPHVVVDDAIVDALCAAAVELGIDSIRASLLAVRAARVCAALRGAERVESEDAARAARLVLAPRATRLPSRHDEAEDAQAADDDLDETADEAAPPPESDDAERADDEQEPADASLDDVVLEAAAASIPAGLLARLQLGAGSSRGASGKVGAVRAGRLRGRPIGTRRGRPQGGARLDLIATLRAAAPWQRVRGRALDTDPSLGRRPVLVRGDDFRVGRFQERARTTTIFAVDASGSSALHRLAEAKGAVELLLADCYVRRDSVAVLGFRGRTADLLLAPTRSLARAKRSLAELAGGGGTPLAHGLDAARELAVEVRRRGDTPVIVVLSDGRANIARDGGTGRDRAEADARAAARRLGDDGISALFIDTSPQPHPLAREIAATMHAVYLPMPYAQAQVLSNAVRGAAAPRERRR